MANEVTIVIKSNDQASAGMQSAKKNTKDLGEAFDWTGKKIEYTHKSTRKSAAELKALDAEAKRARVSVRDVGEESERSGRRVGGLADSAERTSRRTRRASREMGDGFGQIVGDLIRGGSIADAGLDAIGDAAERQISKVGGLTGMLKKLAGGAAVVGAVKVIANIVPGDENTANQTWAQEWFNDLGAIVDKVSQGKFAEIGTEISREWNLMWAQAFDDQGLAGPIAKVADQLNALPAGKTINIGVISDEAAGILQELGFTVERLPDGTVNITANDEQARARLQEFLNNTGNSTGTAKVDADPNPFLTGLFGALGVANASSAVSTVASNTGPFIGGVLGALGFANSSAGTVRVFANTAAAAGAIAGVARDRSMTIWANVVVRGGVGIGLGRAVGGIVGHAAGGITSHVGGGFGGSGLSLVGEQGPELVRLPLGSSITPAGATRAEIQEAAAGQRGGDVIALEIHHTGATDSVMATAIMRLIREGKIQLRAS